MRIYAVTTLLMAFLCIPTSSSSENNTISAPEDKTNLHSRVTNQTELSVANSQYRFIQMAARKVGDLWRYYVKKEPREDTFMGRCLGIARKIKMAMPLIMIMLGVIATVLAFLTLFSLKTLGLLGALLLMNVSGAVSKLTLLFASKKEDHSWKQKPQTVHFHIHDNKKKEHHPMYGGYDYEEWDRNEVMDKELETLQLYNLYDKLKKNPSYIRRNYRRR